MKKFALVQLTPKDARGINAINLGFELVKDIIEKEGWTVDVYKYWEKIEDVDSYDIIGFSIYYYSQMLNVVPFLKLNEIVVNKSDRHKTDKKSPLIIAGGQGIDNPYPIANFVDLCLMGNGEGQLEYVLKNYNDLDKLILCDSLYIPNVKDKFTYNQTKDLTSRAVIKGVNSIVEITRGCKHRCKFCQYAFTSGKYREKDIELVKEQILYVLSQGVRKINLLSCNLGGYSKIVELLDFCIEHNVRILNNDMRIDEYTEEIAIRLDKLKVRSLRVGVESFDEKARKQMNKGITSEQMNTFIDRALKYNISSFHFYLIYGLPVDEDVNEWFRYIKILEDKRNEYERAIRLEFSITNFEPSPNTPYYKSAFIDFDKKHEFMREFLSKKQEYGVMSKNAEGFDYRHLRGRVGRKQRSYNIGMWLMHGDETVGIALERLNIKGARNSISYLYDKIKKICDEDKSIYQIMPLNEKENIWD